MSRLINRETRESMRHEIISTVKEAAKADKQSVDADALVFLSGPSVMIVNTPIAGLDKLDFKAMFDGRPVLDDTPIMYWHLSGDGFEERGAIPAGFYTVVANGKRGTVSLKDAKGKTLAEGDLQVIVESTGTAEKTQIVSIDVKSFDVGWTSVKVCGSVKVKSDKPNVTVTIDGCISIGF